MVKSSSVRWWIPIDAFDRGSQRRVLRDSLVANVEPILHICPLSKRSKANIHPMQRTLHLFLDCPRHSTGCLYSALLLHQQKPFLEQLANQLLTEPNYGAGPIVSATSTSSIVAELRMVPDRMESASESVFSALRREAQCTIPERYVPSQLINSSGGSGRLKRYPCAPSQSFMRKKSSCS